MLQAFRNAVKHARRHGDLYFAALLDQQTILTLFGSASSDWQGWIYTPAVTVWVFLSQCLSPDHSCRDAVARLVSWRVAQGRKPCSPETGSYCIAHDALPEAACCELVRHTGRELEAAAPASALWHGRHVRVVDGSTITMPDTAANQREYPQSKTQKPGCGFPIARILVMFSLATGAVLAAAIGKYAGKLTGENSLFRLLHELLEPGDIVLADRYFSGWFDLALLFERGVDSVVRKHQLRFTDFRSGVRLGHDDHLVRWSKPDRPSWMSLEQYASLPDVLELRELRSARHAARLPLQDRVGHHDAPRRGSILGRRDRRTLPPPLASGAESQKPEGRAANGPFALQESASRSQRDLHASAGLQPDPPHDDTGGQRNWDIGLANQFQRRSTNLEQLSPLADNLHANRRGLRHARGLPGSPHRW